MTIISALIPRASADVVAIFPEAPPVPVPGLASFFDIPGFIPFQLFEGARPMRVQVSEPSQFMTHPLESGAKITDHRIVQPVELTLSMILTPRDYRLTYQLIRQTYLNTIRLSVQTKVTTYTGMYIADMPHEEDPALFDTITLILQLREVQIFRTDERLLAGSSVLNPADASTVGRGEQTASGANDGQNGSGSTLFRVFGGLL